MSSPRCRRFWQSIRTSCTSSSARRIPHVKRNEGETYRLSLQWLAQEKGVEGQVIFYNRFVSLEELVEFIGAADIYITPYLNAAQIVSGTLAYTLGAGKAVISTPYWYAEEMLAEERGAWCRSMIRRRWPSK